MRIIARLILIVSIYFILTSILGIIASFQSLPSDDYSIVEDILWGLSTFLIILCLIYNVKIIFTKGKIKNAINFNKYYSLIQLFQFKFLGLSYIVSYGSEFLIYVIDNENATFLGWEWKTYKNETFFMYSNINPGISIAINLIALFTLLVSIRFLRSRYFDSEASGIYQYLKKSKVSNS
jgi:hypothetical protein